MSQRSFAEYTAMFENACKQLCEDLNFDYSKIEFDNADYDDENYFTAKYDEGEKRFDFDVSLCRSDNSRGSDATIQIYYSKGASPFYFYEKIEYLIGHDSFIGRWAAWAVLNYRKEHDKVDLNSLFYEADIDVNTSRRISNLEIFLTGIKTLDEEIMIYRFRHSEDNVHYRYLSYAFHVPNRDHVWFVFPQLCGLDSGGARRTFKETEELIGKINSKKMTRKNFDIEYDEFARFLCKKAICFRDNYPSYDEIDQYVNNIFFDSPTIFGKEFETSYTEFSNRLKVKKYSQALRDLRALVQQALEKLSEKYETPMKKSDPKIHELVSNIMDIEEPILDGKLRYWFNAFTDVANRTSHSTDFPSDEQMSDPIFCEKIFLTIRLGTYLISEIEDKMSDNKYE